MQKARVSKMSKSPKKKAEVPKASAKTRKAIRFFNGKIPATELLEEVGTKKFKPSQHITTANEAFFNWIESKPWGKWIALTAVTALIVAVAYWGIKQ